MLAQDVLITMTTLGLSQVVCSLNTICYILFGLRLKLKEREMVLYPFNGKTASILTAGYVFPWRKFQMLPSLKSCAVNSWFISILA